MGRSKVINTDHYVIAGFDREGEPILAMTANAFEEDKREAYRCGMNGHLAKPIHVRELMNELANIFG